MKEWTDEDDATISRMLSEGKTRRQIAARFGVTRNAICGRVHRMTSAVQPNAETIAAMQEADAGGGEVFHGTAEEAFAAILASPETNQSAPQVQAPQNTAERESSSDAALGGADTFGPWPLTAEQIERIGHRRDIIRSLTREIEKSSDPTFIQNANWMIEQKKFEIEGILSQENRAAV